MKKTSKLFGAVALSAALALGTAVPAFADPTFNDDQIGVDGSNEVQTATMDADTTSGNTNVFLKTTTTQINATIPLDIVVTANVEGGAMVTPSETAYTISNNNENANLYVKKAVASTETGWTGASDAVWPATGGTAAADPNAANGSFLMRITAKNDTKTWPSVVLVSSNPALKETSDATASCAREIDVNDKWIVPPASSNTAPGVLKLKLEGVASAIKNLKADNTTTEKIMTITYTVTANPADAS